MFVTYALLPTATLKSLPCAQASQTFGFFADPVVCKPLFLTVEQPQKWRLEVRELHFVRAHNVHQSQHQHQLFLLEETESLHWGYDVWCENQNHSAEGASRKSCAHLRNLRVILQVYWLHFVLFPPIRADILMSLSRQVCFARYKQNGASTRFVGWENAFRCRGGTRAVFISPPPNTRTAFSWRVAQAQTRHASHRHTQQFRAQFYVSSPTERHDGKA